MIQLDEIGEKSIELALKEVRENRDNPKLRKKNTIPDNLVVTKKRSDENANQS